MHSIPGKIIGHNGFKYQLDKNWVRHKKLPLKDCHEMVMSASGLLYMLGNETQNNILVFNKDGKVVGSWGNGFPGGHGLTLHNENGEEFLYITDTVRNSTFKMTLEGELVQEFTVPKELTAYQSAAEFKPTETLVMPNGDVYVTDGYGLQYVIQYNAKGEYIRHFGGRDAGEQTLDCAHGIALDDRDPAHPSLLVTSRNDNCFKRFSLEGNYIDRIDVQGSFVCRPVLYGKNIYAAVFRSGDNQNFGSGFITILDENNQVVSSPGASEPLYDHGSLVAQKQLPDIFIHPHDVCIDEDENLYIPQWNSGGSYPIKLTRI
jgi:hypothetical protein